MIVANAITLGLGTYEFGGTADDILVALDETFLGIFVVEPAIRIAAYGRRPQDFFGDGWNLFDFVVIALAFAPGLRATSPCCGSHSCSACSAWSASCPSCACSCGRWAGRCGRS